MIKFQKCFGLKFLILMSTLVLWSGQTSFATEEFSLKESVQTVAQTEIAVFTSPPRTTASKGLYVYSHGMTSRTTQHLKLLGTVYNEGYDIIAYDLPGHGDSERTLGLRGGVRGLDQMLSVLDGVVQLGKDLYGQPKTTILSGWSLGGLITTVYLQKHPESAQIAVLFAPGLSMALAQGDLSILGGVKTENLVQDEDLASQLRSDEGFFRFPPPCLMGAILKGQYRVNWRDYKTNTLLITAGQDAFINNNYVTWFYGAASASNSFILETDHFHSSRHDLENDIDSRLVLATVVEFLRVRSPQN